MQHLWAVTPASRRGAYAASSSELKDRLLSELQSGDAVMIKGSLGSRMGLIVDAMREKFTAVKKES
jgi:UDP-N-acetylmuramoyl-tripeptide--D-alanyl-D-alanine ligase